MEENSVAKESVCPRCGIAFVCGVAAGLDSCWCMDRPIAFPVSDPGNEGKCYCPACLEALAGAAIGTVQGA